MSDRLFAIGDIHGCYDQLRELVEQKINLQQQDTLVLLGDYIDRGPQIKETIDYLLLLKKKGYNLVPLMGNHEAMLLDALQFQNRLSVWMWNGGDATLRSFNINSVKMLAPHYLEFFSGLPYHYNSAPYIFVHAGFNDVIINPLEDIYAQLWTRNEVYRNSFFTNKTIIHGHSPITEHQCRQRVSNRSKVINLDTGCVYKQRAGMGVLTALEVKAMNLFHA